MCVAAGGGEVAGVERGVPTPQPLCADRCAPAWQPACSAWRGARLAPAHRCTIDTPPTQVKAADAHLDSGGGAISGAVTGADVRLRSWGGDVSLKSLVG